MNTNILRVVEKSHIFTPRCIKIFIPSIYSIFYQY